MVDSLGLFLLPWGRKHPHFSTTTPVSRSITPVSAMESSWWIGERARGKP
jgi:hypothetical protein